MYHFIRWGEQRWSPEQYCCNLVASLGEAPLTPRQSCLPYVLGCSSFLFGNVHPWWCHMFVLNHPKKKHKINPDLVSQKPCWVSQKIDGFTNPLFWSKKCCLLPTNVEIYTMGWLQRNHETPPFFLKSMLRAFGNYDVSHIFWKHSPQKTCTNKLVGSTKKML